MDNPFCVPEQPEKAAFKMARIGAVRGRAAQLVFEGEQAQSQKFYKALAHVTLAAGARAVCARIDHTYVIIGIL